MTAVYGLLFPMRLVLRDESSDMTIGVAIFGIVMGLSLPTFMIVISVLQVRTRKIVGSASTVPIKYLRMAGASALSALPIWLVALGSLYIGLTISVNVLGEAHASVALLEHLRTSFMPRWCSVLTVFVVLLPPLEALDHHFNGDIPDWPYAE